MRNFFTLLFAFVAIGMSAQNNRSTTRYIEYQEYQINKNYSDSLVAFQQNANAGTEDEAEQADGRFYKLFAPFTFYHTPARKALRMSMNNDVEDPVSDEIDNTLLSMYLRRPDLVVNSESQLHKIGGVSADVVAPIQQDAELVDMEVSEIIDQEADTVVAPVVTKPKFWTIKGDYFLQGLQSYISGNWYKGGESNYSILGSITMEANYNNKQKVKWDNKLEMKLGFLTSKSDSVHSFKASEDLLRLTSKLGLQATKHWYYTLQLMAATQFTRGFKSNDRRTYSDFMSPFNLNVSIGMDYTVEAWNKKLTGNIHLAPLAYNLKYVDRRWFDEAWMPKRYGKRVEWEWENTFTFQFNKYISTKLFLYPRFDDSTVRDDHHGYFQFQEFMSIGFNYSF